METVIKAANSVGMDTAKPALKRLVQKTAESTDDLVGNKIVDKISFSRQTKK